LDKTWEDAVSSLMTSRGLTGFYMGWAAMALRDLAMYIAARLAARLEGHMVNPMPFRVSIPHFCFVSQATETELGVSAALHVSYSS
jgi:cobalamin biosynthesis protein CobD/CbiB